MLSRDEVEGRSGSGQEEDEMFEGDFDDVQSSSSSPYRRNEGSPFSSVEPSPSSSPPLHRPSLSPSNSKIQISPRIRPEPTEARTSPSPLDIAASSVHIPAESEFPTISSHPSAASAPAGPWANRTLSRSVSSPGFAWGTPGRLTSVSTSSLSSNPGFHLTGPVASGSGLRPSLLSADIARYSDTPAHARPGSEDEDLMLAIQLSLVETQKRGGDV
jgi:hypothetical protein